MADALVGSTVNIALENLLSFTEGQIVMVKEFKKDVESLRETVELISAVLADAEKKQVNHQGVNLWLKKLEALACRAEHVLDEVNYEMLRCRVEGKVSSFFSSHNNIVFRLRMARKIKGIKIEFELINEKATALGLQSQLGAVVANASDPLPDTIQFSREKVSIVAQKVIGRGKDEETIVLKLLSQSNELLTYIPIVGIGGLGKTTLAQSIYNNKKVVEYFGERIWVCVPQGYAPMNIFKLILESLSKDSNGTLSRDNIPLDVVVRRIKEKLKEKRYLLVLDDVWSGHPESSWGEFLGSLCGISTSSGNCIIVTTREVSVALIFCAKRDEHFCLEKLSDEDCLDIVKEKALIHEESIQFFEAIRESIIKICHGVPLVARVIGGLLCRNPSRDWHSLVQKGISNMNGDEHYEHIKQILQLSFDHLHSPSLKKCFIYCSLFQKDSIIEKKELIQLWMAEGFLQPKAGHDDMEIGNECINSLLGSSLLQEVINEEGGREDAVQMHDLVHDLAQSISNPMKDLKDVKEEINRYLVIESFGEETKTLPEMKMLRTLFVRIGTPKSMFLMSFKHLHVLKLYHVGGNELSSSISKLFHLRYLGVSLSNMKAMPESISKLYNLQTLRIENCWSLYALPKGITKLVNLRHLHNDCTSLPPKIGCLTNLQTLEYFGISQNNQIKELGCLANLRGNLTIYNLDRVSSKEEAQLAGLNMKPMNSLSFCWSLDDDQEVLKNDEKVLEGLQPHPNLQDLEISCFKGKEFPSWLKNMQVVCPNQNNRNLSQRFNRLASLSLWSCKNCKSLPILGQLPSLEYLQLSHLDNISRIEPSFYGIDDHHDYNGSENIIKSGQRTRKIFPTLRYLEVKLMENLEEWMEYQASDNECVEIFPNLERLSIHGCPKLRLAPIHYFSSVKELIIDGTDLDIFANIAKYEIFNRSPPNAVTPHVQKSIFTSLETLSICDCPNLSELPEYLYEFRSLRKMKIMGCPNLKSFPTPMGSQQRLTSLRHLNIHDCNGLTSLPHELLTSSVSLTDLHISHCNGLTSLPHELLTSSVSLTDLHISHCNGLTSLPHELLTSSVSLTYLHISHCNGLTSLPHELLASSVSLTDLHISHCHGLSNLPVDFLKSCGSSLQLIDIIPDYQNYQLADSLIQWNLIGPNCLGCHHHRILELKRWPNLVSLPDQLQHLTALKELQLLTLKQIEALPDWFANFVSLQQLRLCGCEKLSYLPSMAAMRSLTKLTDLRINMCPLLKERCIRRNSPDSEWSKISHIPDIRFDYDFMESGSRSHAENADQIDLNCKWLACLPSKTRE